MDWTGGVRRRFAPGKNNATVQKQKSHFAKARATLHNTPSTQQSFRPEFLRPGSKSKAKSWRSQQPHRVSSRGMHSRSRQKHALSPRQQRTTTRYREDLSRYTKAESRGARNISRSPSIAYISSNRSSSMASSKASRGRDKMRKSRSPAAAQMSTISEEERLLLANRRRLLARPDWLGLAATRPVKMKFQSSHDKDRIGKRRKIEKSGSRKGKPAGQRLLTPLFEERLMPQQHLMSGAIMPNDIHVKIGTDALASQTQPSRRSHTSGKTSVRHPSTEFGPLSEEPMLLGEDGDTYEVSPSPKQGPRQVSSAIPDAKSLDLLRSFQMDRDAHHVSQSSEMRLDAGQADKNDTAGLHESFTLEGHTVDVVERVLDSEQLDRSNILANRHSVDAEPSARSRPLYGDATIPPCRSKQRETRILPQTVDAEDDETWRLLMNIKRHTSSHTSMAALASSSVHLTASDNGHQPIFDVPGGTVVDDQHSVSTPKGAGTQASLIHQPHEMAGRDGFSASSGNVHSPSASLRQIMKLADQSRPALKSAEEDDDDSALWRQFVCGTQDDSDEASPRPDPHKAYVGGVEDHPPSAVGSPSLMVSGLGTSNETNAGDTLFVGGSPSSGMSKLLAKRKADLSSERPEHSVPLRTSILAKSTSQDHEQDIIEDVSPLPGNRRQSANIHASSASILNPKRFKRVERQKQTVNSSRRSNTYLPPRTAKKSATSQIHSVYDLVDSHGFSLA